MMSPQAERNRIYLIGNPTRDRILQGEKTVTTLGGTVLYAGLFLARSGIPVSIVGRGDEQMLEWIEARGIGSRYFALSRQIVEFENRYGPNGRQQRARPGEKIHLADVPQSVFQARGVLVGAVLMEVDPRIICSPREGLLLLDVQGFVRTRAAQGQVILKRNRKLPQVIAGCDILKADEQEAAVITGTTEIRKSAAQLHRMGAKIVIITMSSRGSCIHDGRRWICIQAPKLRTADPTGAGDVFDAAFLVEYLRTGDVLEAGRFGTSAAALSVAGVGTAAVPSADQVRRAVQEHFRSPQMVAVERLSG